MKYLFIIWAIAALFIAYVTLVNVPIYVVFILATIYILAHFYFALKLLPK